MRFAILAAFILAAFCFGDGTETQTDWSGGPGIPGPVTTFGTAFDYCVGIDGAVAGEITLNLIHVFEEIADNPRWTDCGDIDGDGDNDLALCGYSSDTLFWCENTDGYAEAWERHAIGFADGPYRVLLADIDGDMDLDAVCGYNNDDILVWYENDGTGGTWTEHVVDPLMDGPRSFVLEDLDEDNDLDIIGASYYDDYVAWYENDGTGGTWTKDTIGTCNGPWIEDAVDLDGDGDIDICIGAYTADSLLWYRNTGLTTAWDRMTISPSFNGAKGGWFADFNGDSYIDVVSVAASGDSLCWFQNADMTGTSWTRHTIDMYDYPWMVSVADLDDDSDSDIMICGTTEDIAYWYENDGSANWTKYTIVDTYTSPYFIGAFDIDMDSVMEVVVNDDGGDIAAYYDVTIADGMLVSSILDAQEDAGWGTISWTDNATGDIEFMVRSSEDAGAMGAWSSAITTSGESLASYTTEGDNYIQYAAVLETDDVASLPVLEDLTITWIFVSIEEAAGAVESYGLSILSGNPSTTAVLGVSIPQSGTVDLSVFDLSGRIVNRITSENMEAGSYQVTLDRLVPGTYFVRMNSGNFTATEKLVLIR